MSAVSPIVTAYATATPYITRAEFEAAPTALDISDLIPNGTQAQQDQALDDTILRASSWCDSICRQVLAATTDIEREWYKVDRNGSVRVPLRYKPVLEVTAVRLGTKPSSMVALTDFSDVVVKRNSVEIPVFSFSPPSLIAPPGGIQIGSRVLVDVTYINGWVNTTLAAGVSAAATSLTVAKSLGIYAGSQFTVFDGPLTEVVTVANTYVAGSTTVPLTTGLAHAHVAGVSISNLPSRVKEAAILLTSVLVQTRGNDAIILEAMENPGRMSTSYGAQGNNVELAKAMLETLIRVW